MFILWITIGVLVGFILGTVFGHVLAIWFAHETVTKASAFYRELVIRGDTAMAMLKHVGDRLEQLGQGKKVIIADDLKEAKKAIDIGHSKIVSGS